MSLYCVNFRADLTSKTQSTACTSLLEAERLAKQLKWSGRVEEDSIHITLQHKVD